MIKPHNVHDRNNWMNTTGTKKKTQREYNEGKMLSPNEWDDDKKDANEKEPE